MKIQNIQSFALMYMKDAPKMPRPFFLVRVDTDSGISGYGEASTAYGHSYPLVIKEVVDGILQRILIGEKATDIERLVTKMRTYLWGYLGPSGVATQAISAIEIALWDILGKSAGLPVYQLLGADKHEVSVYATGSTNFEVDFDWHKRFFEKSLLLGFKGIKLRIGKNKEWDEALVRNMREYVGEDVDIMIDAFMTYKPQTAMEMSLRLAKYKPLFFEEPISQHDLISLERITSTSPIPVALGERVGSLFQFRELIERRIGNVFQPDATIVGGIKECLSVCILAEAFSIPCIPHIGGLSAIGHAANLHVALASRNVSMLELDGASHQPMRDDILLDPIFDVQKRLRDGNLIAPDEPGLGIKVNESVFEEYPYKRGSVYPDLYPQYGAGSL